MTENKTQLAAKQVTIRGVTYNSLGDAARAHNVSVATVSRAVSRGTQDNIGLGKNTVYGTGRYGPQPCTVGRLSFVSRVEAAEHYGVRPEDIGAYIKVRDLINGSKRNVSLAPPPPPTTENEA